jgi:glutamyl-tRNA(Gln) amidotransferase subunit E
MLCGIEIHQRLLGSKLFCECTPQDVAGKGNGNESIEEFTRTLHTVRSELGEVDAAAAAETARSRVFAYRAPKPSTCLVEADEEPPHPPSQQALHAALTICALLSSRVVDEIHVMRKNVIDGSNTSGFQRTMVVGLGGEVNTPSGKLPIQSICLEEESAGIMESPDGAAQYDLSRLGIPLIEIATAPCISSGKKAEEAALAIGTILRKTGMVSRGIGTIRQDLNISIPEGARVEIKGVQDLSQIALTVDLEAQRQSKLAALLGEARLRTGGKMPDESIFDLTEIFSSTQCKLVAKGLHGNARVFGMPLPNYALLLGRELIPNRRFGSELADYARSFGLKGLIHSDESMEKYGFSDDEVSEIKAAMSVGENDAFLLAVADEKKARPALSSAFHRAYALSIIEETRRANPDGTSSYMRPLPGRARMYPETDVEPIMVTGSMLLTARKAADSIIGAQEQATEALSSVNKELAAQLSTLKDMVSHSPTHNSRASTPELSVYLSALEEGIDAKLAASTLTNTLQTLKREGQDTRALDEERMLFALRACQSGVFAKSAMQEILRFMCKNASATPKSAAAALQLGKITGKDLARLVSEESLNFASLMAKYRLRVDAWEAQLLFKKAGC